MQAGPGDVFLTPSGLPFVCTGGATQGLRHARPHFETAVHPFSPLLVLFLGLMRGGSAFLSLPRSLPQSFGDLLSARCLPEQTFAITSVGRLTS